MDRSRCSSSARCRVVDARWLAVALLIGVTSPAAAQSAPGLPEADRGRLAKAIALAEAPAAGQAASRLARALRASLDGAPSDQARGYEDLVKARSALRQSLTPADYRYLEFQLWQEGVARYIELAVARAAAAAHPEYARVAQALRDSLMDRLETLRLEDQRRLAFYTLGAAIALVLDERRPDWKRIYAERRFSQADLLPDPR
jgi:hypothetical protein